MYINRSIKLHRILDRQSRFITKVHDLLGQPSYEPVQEILILIALMSSNGSDEPVRMCSLTRAFTSQTERRDMNKKAQAKI